MRVGHHASDRGVTIIFVAITITVLFGFAAVAVDATGIGTNARRQSQSAADVGALAAVQFATTTDLSNGCSGAGAARAACNGAKEAIAVANATLDDPLLADWSDASNCGTPPAGFTATTESACVAFTANFRSAWVRIPTFDQPTTLAQVIGIDSISVSAEAIAGGGLLVAGAVLPFLLPANAAGTNYNCLKTGPNPNFGACETLPATGNFGSMDFFMYGDLEGNYIKCSGDTNGRLAANVARGIDHPQGLYTDLTLSAPGISESASCPIWNPLSPPNMAQGQPGVGSALEKGLLYGGTDYSDPATPYPGRIEGSVTIRAAQGATPAAMVDSTPLWTLLLDGDGDATQGTECDPNDTLPVGFETDSDPGVSNPDEMEACIDWAKNDPGGPTVIFKDAIRSATRYGWTPEVWEPDFLTPGSLYHIKDYRPVYIDTTLFGCNNNGCAIIHTPGAVDLGPCEPGLTDTRITCGIGGSANKKLSGVTAYVLSQSIVPLVAKTPAPGALNQLTYNLTK